MSLISSQGHPSNCRLLTENASIDFDKRTLSINPFTIEATLQWRLATPAVSESINISGVNLLRKTTESFITDYTIISKYANVELCPCDSLSIVSLTPQKISSPNSNNISQGIESGIGLLEISDEDGNSVEKQIPIAVRPSNTTQEFVSYSNNSLAYHISNNIDSRLRSPTVMGLPIATTKPVFSTYNSTAAPTPVYVRNTNCWAYGIDLTPISPWNSTHGLNACGTLISPRHVLFVEHVNYHPSAGATIHFVDNNNNVVIRTVTAVQKHPSVAEQGTYPDITIGILNEDVPNTISFAKILPDDYINYLPGLNMGLGSSARLPVIITDSPENALVSDSNVFSTQLASSTPVDSQRLAFHETMVTGDSGSPVCFIINNSLVILGTVTWSGPGNGTATLGFKNDINTIMTSLGGGYQLTEVDLSAFPFFGAANLLLHFDADTADNSGNNVTVTNDGVTIDTTTTNFGSGSAYFNGANVATLTTPDLPAFGFGTGDFTIEMFVNQQSGTRNSVISVGTYQNGILWRLLVAAPDTLYLASDDPAGIAGSNWLSTDSIPLGTWTHIALTRQSGTVCGFVGGVKVFEQTGVTADLGASHVLTIGCGAHELSPTDAYYGYIDELRIIKGEAVYTGNFTPPTAPFN